MSEEQAIRATEGKSISPLEAYNILLQRCINEDRILGERTSLFFLATSFLFLAFVTLFLHPSLTAPIFKVLRIALPILGIFLTFLLYCLNRAATNAIIFWHTGQRKIEEEAPALGYMRDNEVTLHIHGEECIWGRREWKRNKEGKWILESVGKPKGWLRNPVLSVAALISLFPAVFFVLWVISLVAAIIY